MTDVTIQLSEAAAAELALALGAEPPQPISAGPDAYAVGKVVAGAVTILKSKGITSITRGGAGYLDITLEEAMPDSSFGVLANGRVGTGVPAFRCEPPSSSTTFRITCWNNSIVADADFFTLQVFKDGG